MLCIRMLERLEAVPTYKAKSVGLGGKTSAAKSQALVQLTSPLVSSISSRLKDKNEPLYNIDLKLYQSKTVYL